MNENKWNSRKLLVVAVIGAGASVLLFMGKLSPDQFVDLIKWSGVGYFGAQGYVDSRQ